MEFTIGPVQSTNANGGSLKVVPATKSDDRRDRRKKKQDRRKNVRDGIYVSLSVKEDQRRPGDRRKNSV